MAEFPASDNSSSHIPDCWIQRTAGIVPVMAFANLQCALKNLLGEDNYALA
jgi:hypothetical protein